MKKYRRGHTNLGFYLQTIEGQKFQVLLHVLYKDIEAVAGTTMHLDEYSGIDARNMHMEFSPEKFENRPT